MYEVSSDPSIVCLCHCSLCRRSVGASPVAWATFERTMVRVLEGEPRWVQSSDVARRAFCERCGCALFFETTRAPGEIDITVATLSDPHRWPPDRHTFVPSKLAWARTDDGLACYVDDSDSELL